MHGVEDVLVHDVDVETVLFAERAHAVDEIVERHGQLADVDDHDHGEILVEDGLGDVENVRAALRAARTDLGDDSDGVPPMTETTAFMMNSFPDAIYRNNIAPNCG